LAKCPDRVLEIDGVPQDSRSDHRIEAACAMMLGLEATVAQFT